MQRRARRQSLHDQPEDSAHLLLGVGRGHDVRLDRRPRRCCFVCRAQRAFELSGHPPRQGVGGGVAGQADEDGEATGGGERLQQRPLRRREAARQVDDDVPDIAEGERGGADRAGGGERQVILVVVGLGPATEVAEEADDLGGALALGADALQRPLRRPSQVAESGLEAPLRRRVLADRPEDAGVGGHGGAHGLGADGAGERTFPLLGERGRAEKLRDTGEDDKADVDEAAAGRAQGPPQ